MGNGLLGIVPCLGVELGIGQNEFEIAQDSLIVVENVVTEQIHEEGGLLVYSLSWVTFGQDGFSWMMPYARYASGGISNFGGWLIQPASDASKCKSAAPL
jgi:hypothetical protein